MKRSNNPLDHIRIAVPCAADWDAMYGNEKVRFCAECRLNVYNLSEMSKDEAEGFLINSEGRVCIRLYQRHDGTIITRNCPAGLAAVRRKVTRSVAAVFSLFVSFMVGLGFHRILTIGENFSNTSRPDPYVESKPKISFGGGISNLSAVKASILRGQRGDRP